MSDNKLIPILTRFASLSFSILGGWLLPEYCLLCGCRTLHNQPMCPPCHFDLPILPSHCRLCAQFLPPGANNDVKCGACLRNPPDFSIVHALFPYETPIMQLIVRLKFQHQLSIARALGILLACRIRDTWYLNQALPDVIIPVPLHPFRLRERGFNQALEIARPVAKILKLALDRAGLERKYPTAPQSSLPAAQREQNIKNAFVVKGRYNGQYIALVDDVMTTGSTLRECSRILKREGASRVDIWCCARRG